jgi:hypothetical protein
LQKHPSQHKIFLHSFRCRYERILVSKAHYIARDLPSLNPHPPQVNLSIRPMSTSTVPCAGAYVLIRSEEVQCGK